MLLNDNEYSIQTIREKTNITIENLEKLSKKDWSHFKKPQVNGLISIIEREFNVDLSELKEEAIAYYKEHLDKEPDCPIDLVDAATVSGGGSRVLSNLITIISLCAVGYAGWYYFSNGQSQKHTDENGTVLESGTGMFADTINSAKKLLGSDKKDANTSKKATEETITKKVEEVKSEDKPQVVVQNASSSPINVQEQAKSEEANSTEVKTEAKKFDITTVSQASKQELSSQEENKSEVAESGTEVDNVNTNSTTQENNSSIKGEVDTLLKELDVNNSKKEEKSDKDISRESNTTAANNEVNTADTVDTANSTSATTQVTFNLKAKRLWLGIYNLTTHKKINKFIKKPFNLNVGEDKLAIVTGHSAFEIATDGGTKRFTKKGKVYFTIDKDGITQLNRKEYRKLTKRRAW